MLIQGALLSESTGVVLDTFMGPPPLDDPNYIRLKEAGMNLDKRIFNSRSECFHHQKPHSRSPMKDIPASELCLTLGLR